ncbi:MAG: hypothetical protein ACJAVI_000357 [Candidatus Azotimanducaceae bacterium]|jgi:hypothetical protein
MNIQRISVIFLFATLFACSEGGTGGTGAVIAPPPAPNAVSGHASKGPLRTGSAVSVNRLNENGSVAELLTQELISTDEGKFVFEIDNDEVVFIKTIGPYFSEVTGAYENAITLSAIANISASNELYNTNLLTTLTSPRIQRLMNDGMSVTSAISTAESELIIALRPILPAPSTTSRFTNLLVISRLQAGSNQENNAYLLAISSIFEQLVQTRTQTNGDSAAENMGAFINLLSSELATSGQLSNGPIMAELVTAMTELNPDQVLLNLYRLDTELQTPTAMDSLSACEVLIGELTCAGNSAQNQNVTSIIADLNRFLDSDKDGILNSLDTDDDNDGVPDTEDTRPYSDRSLAPVGSPEVFESFVKQGLSEWAGLESANTGVPVSAIASADGLFAELSNSLSDSRSDNFSEINVQVQGVDEADLTRFDGSFFYTAKDNEVSILAANNASPSTSLVNTITLSDNTRITGLYLLKGDDIDSRLAVLGSDYQYRWRTDEIVPWNWTDGATRLSLYNVESAQATSEITTLDIQGYLIDSRRIGNLLYLVTRSTPSLDGLTPYPSNTEEREQNQEIINNAELNDLLPTYTDSTGVINALVSAQNCLVPNLGTTNLRNPSLVTVSAINLQDPSDINSVCMAESVFSTYVSLDSMYLVSSRYNRSSQIELFAGYESIAIHKFSFSNIGPIYAGSGVVDGGFATSNPAYRMGEHEGRLTVITSETFNSGHKITLLEEGPNFSLVEVGQLPNAEKPNPIGKEGEMIYSTRIIGDRAYIVTFLTTDPVYVIDLADLNILGELEIPGFSSYLHPISDDLLLGIGKSAIVENNMALFQGIKIQLFDISDPATPVSTSEFEVGFRGTDSAVSYDPHAFSYRRNLETGVDRFTLPIDVHGTTLDPSATASTFYPYVHTGLYLFELDTNEASINPKGAITHQLETCTVAGDRGFLADDAVHFFSKGQVLSADWNSPDQISSLSLFTDDGPCFFF